MMFRRLETTQPSPASVYSAISSLCLLQPLSTPPSPASVYSAISSLRLLRHLQSSSTPASVYSANSSLRLLRHLHPPSTPPFASSVYSAISSLLLLPPADSVNFLHLQQPPSTFSISSLRLFQDFKPQFSSSNIRSLSLSSFTLPSTAFVYFRSILHPSILVYFRHLQPPSTSSIGSLHLFSILSSPARFSKVS